MVWSYDRQVEMMNEVNEGSPRVYQGIIETCRSIITCEMIQKVRWCLNLYYYMVADHPLMMRCYRSDWVLFVLLLSTCVCQPTELILGFFLFHNSNFTPPPPIYRFSVHPSDCWEWQDYLPLKETVWSVSPLGYLCLSLCRFLVDYYALLFWYTVNYAQMVHFQLLSTNTITFFFTRFWSCFVRCLKDLLFLTKLVVRNAVFYGEG